MDIAFRVLNEHIEKYERILDGKENSFHDVATNEAILEELYELKEDIGLD